MNKGVARLFAAAAVSIALAPALPALAQNRIYYVDYDSGSDDADGLSPATAWKHVPGDPESPTPFRWKQLKAGDQVRFKGGVRYRSSIGPTVNGTAEAPVIFDGSSWGPTRAIFDGSNPLNGVRPCASAADCLGSQHWKNLWRADLPAGSEWTDYLFVNDQVFQLAQYPSLSKLDADNTDKYLPIPKASLAQLRTGRINHLLPAGFDKGTPLLALWSQPNAISVTRDARISSSGVEFAGAKWQNATFSPYTDRDNAFSLMNVPDQVNRPGLFAISPKDGVAIFWPMPSGTTAVAGSSPPPAVSIGGRRYGINTTASTYLTIRGFSFTSYAWEYGNWSTGSPIRGS